MTTATEHSSTQEDNQAAFAAGFSGEELPPDTTAAGADDADPAIDDKPEAEAAQAVAAPEFVTITPDQWNSVQSGLAELADLKRGTRAEFDKLGGKYGEINRAIQQRPAGMKFSKEALSEIESEYPDLGAKLKALFTEAGEAPAPAAAINPDEIERRVQERLRPELDRINQLAIQQVDYGMKSYHRDWKQVVASPDFETWRKSLPEAEAMQTLQSDDVDFAAGQIDKFKAHRQTLAEKAAADAARKARQQNGAKRLEAAITPQGTAKTGAPTKTEHDYFRDGFKS